MLPHHLIISTRITEKTTFLSEFRNCVVFEVSVSSNKLQIRDAVESVWAVRVLSVRTQTRVGKIRRRNVKAGRCRDRKFAIVQLHSDDRLAFY